MIDMWERERGWSGIVVGFVLLSVAAMPAGCGGEPVQAASGPVTGAYGRVVFEAEPLNEPAEGTNEFRVTLEEVATGAPLEGATFTVRPRMPSMGHSAAEDPVVMETGGGTYAVSNVIFSMPGTWEVYYRVTRNTLTDEALFSYDVR